MEILTWLTMALTISTGKWRFVNYRLMAIDCKIIILSTRLGCRARISVKGRGEVEDEVGNKPA